MQNKYSFIASCLAAIILIGFRLSYPGINSGIPLRVTTWDAFGYYMYLPAVFIYHDLRELEWIPEADQKYGLTGGHLYQAQKGENGYYFFKYLGGVALMQMPAFAIGHSIALVTGQPNDGFSSPYQYAIISWVLLMNILAIFLLRKILLRYFTDAVCSITLLLLLFASNYIQYVSVDSAMSHAFIFPLYVAVLYTTMKWHERPAVVWASLTGFIIGLAVISRPTEIIMLFIPLLWGMENKNASRDKWLLIGRHKKHIIYILAFGFIAVLPQLVYWKYATGSFIYDVGSKWDFLKPHFRVLFGFEKGWFVYTPITLFFIAGLFFLKEYPFRKAVITFCLLNIYIIISWHDWRYGASYSCRALVQSYPLFALSLAAFIEYIQTKNWRFAFWGLGIYLILVNLFQVDQYNHGIIHYDDMNRKYYGRIYLNFNPDPLDVSLLDTEEILNDESNYDSEEQYQLDSVLSFDMPAYHELTLSELEGNGYSTPISSEQWIKVEASLLITQGISCAYLYADIVSNDSIKQLKLRLFSPISQVGLINDYAGFVSVPGEFESFKLRVYIKSCRDFAGQVERLVINFYRKGVGN